MTAALPISLLLIRTAYSVMISRYSLLQKRSRIAIMPYKGVDDIEKVDVGFGNQAICAVTKDLLRLLTMPSNARANFLGRYDIGISRSLVITLQTNT